MQQVDKALVNVGSMFLETVTARVSTAEHPRNAHDKGAGRSGTRLAGGARLEAAPAGRRRAPAGRALCAGSACLGGGPRPGSLCITCAQPSLAGTVAPPLATADKLVARGRQLVAMYHEVGVERERVLLRMPATWAAIQVVGVCVCAGGGQRRSLKFLFLPALSANATPAATQCLGQRGALLDPPSENQALAARSRPAA